MNNSSITRIGKLVIIGVGLIGGSFALALRQAGMVQHIIGIGRNQKNMHSALERGVIGKGVTSITVNTRLQSFA